MSCHDCFMIWYLVPNLWIEARFVTVYDPTMVVPLLSISGTGNILLVLYCDNLTMSYLAYNILRPISKHLWNYLTIAAILTMYFVEMCAGPEAVNTGHTEHQLCHMLSAFIINEKQNHRYFIWSHGKLMVNNISQEYD